MKLYVYNYTVEDCWHQDIGRYQGCCVNAFGLEGEELAFLVGVRDVTHSFALADEIVDILNKGKVSPLHMEDVIRDWLP